MYAVAADNPWIAAARAAPRPAPAWTVALCAVAWGALVIAAYRALAPAIAEMAAPLLAGLVWPWRLDLQTTISLLAVYGPLLAAALVGGAIERRAVWRTGLRPYAALPLGLVLGAGGIAVSLFIAFLAGAVARGAVPPPGPETWAPEAVDALLMLAMASVEEIMFRGWIQPRLAARWGPWAGLLAASAMFAALHMVGGPRSALAVCNIFLAGVFFGLLALRTGGLIAPCAAHFGWNWFETTFFATDPAPSFPFGAIYDLDLRGPALWSGDGDTMNGSLATTLTLGALILGLTFLAPSRSAAGAGYRSGYAP